ncbi:MFS transporter [Aeromicrobium sp. CF3.5]|uniref:MFS transporter n=1 Tax=Aeromicrobium sp. CF3.5 TaxID=3373078 RepID=UPI003EE632EA
MPSIEASVRRARIATFGFFALNGYVLGLWVVNIPEIRDRTGASTEQLGYLILLLGGAALVGMQAAGRLIDRFGSGVITRSACVALSLSLIGPAWSTSIPGLAVALALVGLANGFVDVGQNSHAVEVETAYQRPIMSAFHAMFSLGGLLAAVVGGSAIGAGVDLRWTLGLSAALGAVASVAFGRHLIAPSTRDVVASSSPADPGGRTGWSPRVLLIAVLAFALFLSEGVAYDWSTVHLHDVLDADKSVAAWAFGAFSVTMTIVRLVADRIVARIGPAAYVQRAALVGAVGLTTATLAPTPWIAIVGWAVFGVGLAGCVPQFFSAAGRIDPANAGLYMARVTSFGYVGMLAGPALIGIATRWISLTTAFALPIAGCVLAALLARRALSEPERELVP